MQPDQLPSLKALRAFDMAARHGSFSQAAEQLHVTHGAISRLIRQLESALNVTLFERHAEGVRLTAAGDRLRESTRPAFRLLAEGCQSLRQWQGPPTVVLAAPGSFLMRWLIPRMDQLAAAHPDIRLQLQALETPEADLLQGVDLAIAHETPASGQWQTTLFAEDRLGPVCTPALAQALKTPEDLARVSLMHVASRPQAWQEWARAASVAALPEETGTAFDHLSFMLEAVLSGTGVAVAPQLLVEADLKAGRLRAPFGFVRGGRDYLVLCRHGASRAKEAVVEWLLTQRPGEPQ